MAAAIPDPVFDAARLAAVRASGLLDSPAEEPFDRLTRLAAAVLRAPLAFATVVDERRSFWKSCIGVDPAGPRENPVEESFCQYVIGTRTELLVGDARNDPRTRDNPSVHKMGVAAWAGFPLLAPNGQVLGSFCVMDLEPREWTDQDAEVLRTLAAAAAGEIALRATVIEAQEHADRAEALALTLQESLLPPSLPHVPGLDVSARHVPAGTGTELLGDFYDLFPVAGDSWCLVVGDVCGKGVGAAKVTALARYTVAGAAIRNADPSEVLSTLNEATLAHPSAQNRFLTAVVAFLSPPGRGGEITVRMAGGGHPAPLVRRAGGQVEAIDTLGPLLGYFPDVELPEVELRLEPGDLLLVHTDGLTDARRDGELFGDRRVRDLVAEQPGAGATETVQALEEAALAFSGGPPADDLAIVAVRVVPGA